MKKERYQYYHYLKKESHHVCNPSCVVNFFIVIVLCSFGASRKIWRKSHLLVKSCLKISRVNEVENDERKWKWRKMVRKRWGRESEIERKKSLLY